VTDLRVNWQALNAASSQVEVAADMFERGRGQVEGTPRAAGATGEATDLLARALESLSEALGKAAAEMQQVSSHLAATSSRYESTERALAAWKVPGSGGRAA
jgi:hypothetical protein